MNNTGAFTATRKYDVYGAVRSSTGGSGTKHKFCGGLGHPSEDDNGLIYMRARYYDPLTGRFVSEDPGSHGDNWFNYADANPVSFGDPSGRFSVKDAIKYPLDKLVDLLWDFAVGLILSGFAQVKNGALLMRFGQLVDKLGDAVAALGLAGMVGGALAKIDGWLAEKAGGTLLIGGAKKIAAGLMLLAIVEFLAGEVDEIAEAGASRLGG